MLTALTKTDNDELRSCVDVVRGNPLVSLVRVLMLVACVPMLLPPGICMCDAGALTCTDPHRTADLSSASYSPASGRCCHCHTSAETEPDLAAAEQSAHDHLPAPHDDHAQRCPAAPVDIEKLQRAESTIDACQVAVLLACFEGILLPVTHVPRLPVCSVECREYSPPLYLTHCSLII